MDVMRRIWSAFALSAMVGLLTNVDDLSAQRGNDPAVVLQSIYSARDLALTPDPALPEWAEVPKIVIDRDYFGQPIGAPPTEVRSRWTTEHLYLLYSCYYDA